MRSLRRLIIICVLTVGMAAPLFAQDQESPGLKSPGAALALSGLGTVVPIAIALGGAAGDGGGAAGLFLGGLILGPSLGYLYAGETGPALKGIGWRVAVLGASAAMSTAICSSGCDLFGSDDGSLGAAIAVALAGIVTTSVLAISDVARVEGRVRARNERVSALSMRLTYLPETHSPGVLVTLRW